LYCATAIPTPELTANQPWKKQRHFGFWIETTGYLRFAGRLPGCRGEASAYEQLEAFFRFQKRLCVIRIKVMTGIAGVVHYDLGCHRKLSLRFAPSIKLQWWNLPKVPKDYRMELEKRPDGANPFRMPA
jgi:hypothetical protein